MGFRVRLRDDDGFTLVELMVIALIIAVLLGIAVAAYVPATRSASAAACRQNQEALQEGAVLYSCTVDGPPVDDITDLSSYVRNFDTASVCPLDSTPLVYDPATRDVSCPNHP